MVKYEINLKNLIDYINGDNSKLKKIDNFINIGIKFIFQENILTKFLILLKDILTKKNFNKQSKEKESLDNDNKCKIANIVLAKLALKDTINEILKDTKRNRANWKMNLNTNLDSIENNFKNGNIKPESYLEQSISTLLELETLKNIDNKKELIERSKEKLKAYKNTLITESRIYATFSNNSNEKEQNDYSNLYITIEEFEKKLIESTEPSINLDFFNYKDNSFIKNLEPKLNSKAIYVQSREKEEAIYYIIYLLKNNYPEEIERTGIIESYRQLE